MIVIGWFEYKGGRFFSIAYNGIDITSFVTHKMKMFVTHKYLIWLYLCLCVFEISYVLHRMKKNMNSHIFHIHSNSNTKREKIRLDK